MKKIAITLLILLVATWAFAETKLDPTKENGLTHLVRITRTVNQIVVPARPAMLVQERIAVISKVVVPLRYKTDVVDHPQHPDETARLLTGDCEDFTFYFLYGTRYLGQPLGGLGVLILVSDGMKQSHFAAIYQKENGEWWVWETSARVGEVFPLAWYLAHIDRPKLTMILFGLEDFDIIHILDKETWETHYFGPWLLGEQERVKKSGLAYE